MFEINVLLKITRLPGIKSTETGGPSRAESTPEVRDKVTYEISPNEFDFKNATRDLINQLETTVGQIPSLCDHPTLRIFATYPGYDPVNPNARTPVHISEIHWPDVDFLFGDDIDHQEIIVDALNTVNRALTNVQTFVKVDNSFEQRTKFYLYLFYSAIKSIVIWFSVVFN